MGEILPTPRIQTDKEMEQFKAIQREFTQMVELRNPAATECEEIASLILPTSRNTFMYGSSNTPGIKKTEQQVDATGMMALQRFAAICDSLLTPRNMTWHTLEADNEYVMKDRATRLWFENTTKKLFKMRYSPHGNFSSQNQSVFQSLGAFGTGTMFIDKFVGMHGERGIRYKAVPLGEMFLRQNYQGLVDGFIRWFRLTALQAYHKWHVEPLARGEPSTFPAALLPALEQSATTPYNFLHRVAPRTDYDREMLDYRGMPLSSCYVSLEGQTVLEEGGYNVFPLAPARYYQAPDEVYGRGPASMVLPALKTLNAEKRTFLTQGHRAASPAYLTTDDGIVGFSMRPGAMNPGGVNADGKPLVHMLPTGEIQISKEMMQEEKSLINDAFLVTLFQILTESPQMTATEVIERTTEKGILLAPTIGRQQSEYLGPMIDRELDLMAQLGALDPMPPALKEAGGAYSVVYTSPMSRTMRAPEAAGFWRTVDQATAIMNVTQDPSIFDPFDFESAIKQTADINGTLPSFMASDEQVAAKVKKREQIRKNQEQIQAAPAKAALMSATAKQAAAGIQGGPGQPGQPQQ